MRISTFAAIIFALSIASFAQAQEEGDRGVGFTFTGSTGGFSFGSSETETHQTIAVALERGNYDFGVVNDRRETGYVEYLTVFCQRNEYGRCDGGLRYARYFPVMNRNNNFDIGPEGVGGWSWSQVYDSNKKGPEYGGGLCARMHTSSGALLGCAGASKLRSAYVQIGFEFFSRR